MTKPVIIILTPSALTLAKQLKMALGGEIHSLGNSLDGSVTFVKTTEHIEQLFRAGRAIVGLCASGILIRAIAPALTDKLHEPAVVAVAEDGSSAVPLVGGHHGANDLARRIAEVLGTHAAITTASDLRLGIAIDVPPKGYVLSNAISAKSVTSRLLGGERLNINGIAPWLDSLAATDGTVPVRVSVFKPVDDVLTFHPRSVIIGVGCERGAGDVEVLDLIQTTLAEHNIAPESVAHFATIDLKEDEAAISNLGEVRYFSTSELNSESHRILRPSETVRAEVGTPSVAEAAALAATGPLGSLIVAKQKSRRATCAVAVAPGPIDIPRGRVKGVLHVIGLGPGSPDMRTPDATRKLAEATDWVGYDLYLELARDQYHGQTLHRFPLGAEEQRVRHAISLAKNGKRVALISSGDAGIYAMASLVYEVLDFEPNRIAIDVVPGVSAFQAAAARAGALIGHDFCCISLSDLLTPWEMIERRLHAAAEGDFVVAFYNPRSQRRTDQLGQALEVLRGKRPPETPVVMATNLGRKDEFVRVVTLGTINPEEVDMLTVLLVGSSQSAAFKRGDGSTYAYTPRGYAAKMAAQ